MTHDHSRLGLAPSLLATEKGIRALKISIVGLLLTAFFQLVIVFISGSAALFADTLHNFADAFTSIPLWIAFVLGRRRPTRSLTYGYGRAEDVAGIIIILVILGSAVLAAYESVQKLIAAEPISHLGWVMTASVIGFLGNEIVAQYRIKIGREIGSAALVADGQHSRIDGLTSLAVLIGVLGVMAGFPAADPIVGIAISVVIFGIVVQASREILKRLMDVVDPTLLREVEATAKTIREVTSVHDVRARWVGHELHVDLSIAVDGELSVSEGHEVAKRVHSELLHHIPHLSNISIHVDPDDQIGVERHVAKVRA